ncbi:abhydrolase domain-containing protein 12 [Pancytospora philotis]|nr:abhydrolase domain-containing protein 12 [Pancytospora philotis]
MHSSDTNCNAALTTDRPLEHAGPGELEEINDEAARTQLGITETIEQWLRRLLAGFTMESIFSSDSPAVDEDSQEELALGSVIAAGAAEFAEGESVERIGRHAILNAAMRVFLSFDATKRPRGFFEKFEHNIYLTTEDGLSIGAFLFGPESTDAATRFFVLCHGKGCSRYEASYFMDFKSAAAEHNVCLLLLDYRAFGDSEGEYTIEGVNRDLLAAFAYLRTHYGAAHVSLVGHSLGCAIAMEFAHHAVTVLGLQELDRVFLLAPFSSTLAICRDFAAFNLLSFFIPDLPQLVAESFNYENAAKAAAVGKRLYVFHGLKDTVIKASHGEEVAAAAQCEIEFTQHRHIDIFYDPALWKRIFDISRQ